MNVLKAGLKQLRPKQWAKNVLVFAALIFSGRFMDAGSVGLALLAFASFSLIASAGYILNDWLDREADRKHPKKKFRPIASGALPPAAAWALLAVVTAIGVGLAAWLSPLYLAVVLLYFVTTMSYSLYFKHHVILDVMMLGACYVWRVIGGAVAIGVAVSEWLFLCTAFVSLFIGFNKRRAELAQLGSDSGTRKNLQAYSPTMIAEFQAIVTSGTVMSYMLYAALGPSKWMTLTIPFVLYGVFRYIYLVDRHGEGAAPDETLLQDIPILLTGALYAITAMAVVVFTAPV